jgi:hypothetical protein
MPQTTPAPKITRQPLPAAEHVVPRSTGGYGCHEVATITCGAGVGRVWRHLWHDGSGIRLTFDATCDLTGASDVGLGEDPQAIREIASVLWALADELAEAQGIADAKTRHPSGKGRGLRGLK